jgi:hypothetical protein
VASRAVHVVAAAALFRAGVALACPEPPSTDRCQLEPLGEQVCTPSGALDLDLAIPQGVKDSTTGHWVVKLEATRNYGWGGVNVCDAMVLFRVSDTPALSDVTATLRESPTTALRNVRITGVASVNTPHASGIQDVPLRYGSGAFCLWTHEDEAVAGVGPEVFQVTVEAFDAQGNVHRGQALIETVCTVDSTGVTSQQAYYQYNVDSSGVRTTRNDDFCGHMNNECVADADLPATCGPDVCQCSDITPPPDGETPATPGNVCVNGGDLILCGPVVPPPPGTPSGEVCIANGETVVCGPVSVCVSTPEEIVCGPATGPGTSPGEVCIANGETVLCGPVAGSGSGPGNSGGDVCIANGETVLCGPVTSGGSGDGDEEEECVPNGETVFCDPDDGTASGSPDGEVCIAAGETTCGQVPVAQDATPADGPGTEISDSTGSSPKSGCAAFPGADLGLSLLALLGLGALRRRR